MIDPKPLPATPEDISLNIRDLVIALNEAGFETTDSGDGSNCANGMECGWTVPMVVVAVACKQDLVRATDDLCGWLRKRNIYCSVEGTYSPVDGVVSVVAYGNALIPRCEKEGFCYEDKGHDGECKPPF